MLCNKPWILAPSCCWLIAVRSRDQISTAPVPTVAAYEVQQYVILRKFKKLLLLHLDHFLIEHMNR